MWFSGRIYIYIVIILDILSRAAVREVTQNAILLHQFSLSVCLFVLLSVTVQYSKRLNTATSCACSARASSVTVQRYSSRVAFLDADEVVDGHWRLCIGGSEDKDVGGLDDRHLAELVRRNMRANNVYVSTSDYRSVITPDHLDLRTNWIYSELSSFRYKWSRSDLLPWAVTAVYV